MGTISNEANARIVKALRKEGLEYTALYAERYGADELMPVPFMIKTEELAEEAYKNALAEGKKIEWKSKRSEGRML